MDVKTRFVSKVKIVKGGCHYWQSTKHRQGYGKFYLHGKQEPAHRVAFTLYVGPIPEDKLILHKCDNTSCVNPAHLYIGDTKQNAKDRTDRRRWTHERLTEPEVKAIRRAYATGKVTQQKLANSYGVHQTQISRIIRYIQRTTK